MAETTHVLKLKATLDTSEVKQKLDQLNQQRASSARKPSSHGSESGSAQSGTSGMSTASTAATAVALSQVAKAMKALQPSARSAEQSVKSMSQVISSTKNIIQQTFGEINKILMSGLNKRYGAPMHHIIQAKSPAQAAQLARMSPDSLQYRAQHILAQRTLLSQLYGPFSAIKGGQLPGRLGQVVPVSEFPSHTAALAELAGGLPYAGMPAQGKMVQDARREAKAASAKRAASKWTSLGRWAAGYGLTLAGDQIAQLAGESTYAGQAIGSMSRIGSTAVAGGAIGMSAGPLGAAAGFVGGSAFGLAKELVAALNANTEAEKQMVALYSKEGYGKRIAGYKDMAARRSMMEDYAFEKELGSISTSSLKEAESTLASLISTISQLEAKISSGQAKTAPELASLLKQREDATQARSAALSRVDELRGEQKAEAEKEARKREAEYEGKKQLEELRRMSKFKVRMSEMSKNGQVAELQSLYASFASKMAGAQDAATWQRASLGAGIVQQAITSHSAEKLASLQQLLASSGADMSHVTSLGQFGYGMGEKNDNVERQMRVWEEQAQLQRDIRDILDSRSFPAVYE